MGESCSRCLNYNDKNNSDATHITTQEINTRGGPRELLAFLIFGYKKHFPKQAPILFLILCYRETKSTILLVKDAHIWVGSPCTCGRFFVL